MGNVEVALIVNAVLAQTTDSDTALAVAVLAIATPLAAVVDPVAELMQQ